MPRLVIVNGLPASGKTTLAGRLSKELKLPVFSKDDFKELLADTIGFTDHESTSSFGKASFAALFMVARRCLESGSSLIIEGNFSLGDETESFIAYLKEAKIDVYEILLHGDRQILADRFRARKRHPVHHTLDQDRLQVYLETTIKEGKDIAPTRAGRLLEIDTTDPDRIPYQEILDFIEGE